MRLFMFWRCRKTSMSLVPHLTSTGVLTTTPYSKHEQRKRWTETRVRSKRQKSVGRISLHAETRHAPHWRMNKKWSRQPQVVTTQLLRCSFFWRSYLLYFSFPQKKIEEVFEKAGRLRFSSAVFPPTCAKILHWKNITCQSVHTRNFVSSTRVCISLKTWNIGRRLFGGCRQRLLDKNMFEVLFTSGSDIQCSKTLVKIWSSSFAFRNSVRNDRKKDLFAHYWLTFVAYRGKQKAQVRWI